jgi:hypothetical protein
MTTWGKSLDFLFNQMRNGSEGSLAGGTVYFYEAGTTSGRQLFLDRAMTQGVYSQLLSADGTAELYGAGLFRIVVKDAAGVTIYDYDDVEIESIYNVFDNTQTLSLNAAAGNVNVTPTGSNIGKLTAMRTDNSAYTATITLPTGYTMAGSGESTYALTQQGEAVTLQAYGIKYYVV